MLELQAREVFAASGVLARSSAHFSPRDGQTDMAVAVAQTIEAGGVLVVEAGTGVGKTFAYLVPALLSGERIILSTATKALQDQLFGRDLPGLVAALGLPTRMALLKGRASYLCVHRMELALHDGGPSDRAFTRALIAVEAWARTTRTGDLAELEGLDERSPVIPLITSTRENCLGATCPRYRACHVNLARREALAADFVVINHHLFFADLAVRESGMAELLPTARVVIFDEAHQLNEIGVQFLGVQLTTGQLLDLARDLLAAGLQLARGLADWTTLAADMERAARDLRLHVGRVAPGAKLRWTGLTPSGVEAHDWTQGLSGVREACAQVLEALTTVSEVAPDFIRLHERVVDLGGRAERFAAARRTGCVRWVDVGAQLRLVESPLDIAEAVQNRLLGPPNETGAVERAWIFTSATLGNDERLQWFTEPCGLTGARVLRVASPFDFARQAAIYVPPTMPRPDDASHSKQVAILAGDSAERLGGSTLVLTTTLRALRVIGDALAERFGPDGRIEVLVQGQLPKRVLMARFREGSEQGRAGCVLVASASFWEGFDAPGEVLQLVVIDKLPFPPPNDPLVEARAQRLQDAGRSSFMEYFVPEAAVALKQGAGRLIRRESDRGVLVVCDPRLTGVAYGRRLLAALPPMRRLTTMTDYIEALDSLTRASTTGPSLT